MSKNKYIKTFSLLTSCRNGEEYLDCWFDSILNQGYRPLEVVFVDDSSSDKSVDKLCSLNAKFRDAGINLLILRHRKLLKYGSGLLTAAQHATGYFMGVLDVDDALTPKSVEHVMRLYRKYADIGYIYTQFEICDQDMKTIRIGFSREPRKKETILSEGIKFNEHIYSHFRTFSKRIPNYLDIFPRKARYAIDQFMGLSLEEKAKGIFTDRVCYRYRTGHSNSISSKYGGQRREFWHKLMGQFAENRERNNISAYKIIRVANKGK
jgi:glycosyltransferase involved in cell wall biosynthesis